VDFVDPRAASEEYAKWRADDPVWPERMVPLAEKGCGIWTCLDCSQKPAPVVRFRGDVDPGTDREAPPVFEEVAPSLVEWLRADFLRDADGGPID
jgi:hypothetical protein